MKKILHRAGIGLFLTLTPLLAVAQSDADVELLTGEFEAAHPGAKRAEAANRLAAVLTREKALSNTYHFTRNTTEDSLDGSSIVASHSTITTKRSSVSASTARSWPSRPHAP